MVRWSEETLTSTMLQVQSTQRVWLLDIRAGEDKDCELGSNWIIYRQRAVRRREASDLGNIGVGRDIGQIGVRMVYPR